MTTLARRAYAEMFGPTTGDRVRLADTNLVIEVEHDHTLAAGGGAVELQCAVGFGEVVVRADLDRPVRGVLHDQRQRAPAGIQHVVAGVGDQFTRRDAD